MKNRYLKSLILGLVVFASGCASILSDNVYTVSLLSTPQNANYTIKNRQGYVIQKGQTPDQVTLRSSAGYFKPARYTLHLQKEGYAENSVELKGGIDGWYFGNLLLGGALGILFIDPLTGAMWSLPEEQMVGMEPLATPLAPERKSEVVAAATPRDSGREQTSDWAYHEVEDSAGTSPTPEVVSPSPEKPVGYDSAIMFASAQQCTSDIVLDYQTSDGAIYMASCGRGTIKKFACQPDSCRMID